MNCRNTILLRSSQQDDEGGERLKVIFKSKSVAMTDARETIGIGAPADSAERVHRALVPAEGLRVNISIPSSSHSSSPTNHLSSTALIPITLDDTGREARTDYDP